MFPLLALALAVNPPTFDRTLALSIRGERVGVVHLRFDGAKFRYESVTEVRRGTETSTLRFGATTDALGRGRTDDGRALSGPMPSSLALWLFAEGDRDRCIEVEDERDGSAGKVCAARIGTALEGTLLGERFSAVLDAQGGPISLELPAQQTRFEQVAGSFALPEPRDLFSRSHPAGVLGVLEGAAFAKVSGLGDGCDIEVNLARETPAHDEPLGSPMAGGWQRDARDLRLGTRTRWATAVALAKFVDQGIASVPASPADEDARGVWRARRGSCVGQARVFAALGNAIGLPTRVVFGALIEDGRIAAHAWAEVEVGGKWFGVDPSRALAPVGPEHLPFARENDPDPLRAGRCVLALPSMHWTVESH
jgi:hypothetical protein